MQRAKDILQAVLTIAILGGITTVLYLYTSGYRLQKNDKNMVDLTKTGMVNAKSIPESASVYLDDKLITATNDTISGVNPGTHSLRIVKKGFVEWKKDIEVFPELVTDITAVLVSQTPRLEPLTNTGARDPIISDSLTKLAYFSEDSTEPGVYVIPLGGFNVSLFKSNPNIAIKDTKVTKYSQGKTIEWSPDETQLLVQGNSSAYYLVDLQKNTAQTTGTPDSIRKTWDSTITKKRTDALAKLDIPDDIKKLGLSANAVWSPDEKKFLYTQTSGTKIQYKVYDLEKPLPVGEKVENVTYESNTADLQPKFTWYPDSFHLIMVEGNVAVDKKGVISLIRIDGTNKTEIYSNTLLSDQVFSSPGGDKVIILTSYKSGNQTDLYTVGIR